MSEALPLNDAQSCVLQHCVPLGTEKIDLLQSLGRVLAQEVRANRDHPPCDISAMDGYALRAADLGNVPAQLVIVADIKAGDLPTLTVQAGQCVRIMTGAPIPQGADTVIRVEDTQEVDSGFPHPNPDGATSHSTKPASGQVAGYLPEGEGANVSLREKIFDTVQINVSAQSGNDIRRRAENLRTGDVVLTAGTEITPGVLGILAMVKAATVEVQRRPTVAILSSGDELEGLHDPFDADKIPDANGYALMAQVQALGMQPVLLGIARDDPAALRAKLEQGLQYDVLLVSGGTSVGVHDFVRPTLEQLGVRMHFWRVQMRPGHPAAFGTSAGSKVFCLPGNPVASMVSFEQIVAPALRNMLGHTRLYRRTVQARLAQPLKHRPGNLEFVRVVLSRDEHGYLATPTGSQSSGVLLSMARADGLLVVPSESKGLVAGDVATVQLLDGTTFQEHNGIQES
ncbi:MAG: molybdopterin molybdenumtransferase MoeA [Gallionellaceae bacterium]|nr:MAG: molybdopterin molybdenumtransferase MoeA [Gallionellaceae bacterium]